MPLLHMGGRPYAGYGSPAPTPITDFGPNIADWMRQPGDQVLIVPNGTEYHMGSVINPALTAHPSTGGTYGGWLILQAETEGGVTVDLSGGLAAPNAQQGATWGTFGTVPTTPAQRIMFVGFNWIKGSHKIMGMSHLRWWYNDASYTIGDWLSQYQAVGGSAPPATPNRTLWGTMKNIFPTPFRCEGVFYNGGASLLQPTKFGWYGCDVHNCGDDGWFLGSLTDSEIIGCQSWDIYHHGIDPADAQGDLFHNDSIQFTQSESDIVVTDSAMGQRILAIADAGSMGPATFERIWSYGSSGVCFIYGRFNHKTLHDLTVDTIQTFAGGQNRFYGGTSPVYWSDYDQGIYNDTDGTGSQVDISITNVTAHNTIPSGVTVTGGILQNVNTRPSQVVDHASNPANVWRAANPYASWATYFAGDWP